MEPKTPLTYLPLFRFVGFCLISLGMLACTTESSLDSAEVGPIQVKTVINARASSVPSSGQLRKPATVPAKFESPDQYGQFPETRQASGPLNVLARNPYLNDVNADVTAVPMVANASSSAVYPPEQGVVSHYTYDSPEVLASGAPYDEDSLRAAHKTLPFGTIVKCTRTDTGQSVVVMINDRGPYVRGRIIDLNAAAARHIGLKRRGIAPCRIDVLAYPLIETTGPRGNG